jgi:hypothetical protein
MNPFGPPLNGMPGGLDLDRADKGPFLLNVWRQLNGWEVRPGWGQIAKMSTSQTLAGTDIGLRELLGSFAIETNFGSTQILSLWRQEGFTANTYGRSTTVSRYALVIFDATTRRGYDYVLHTQTAGRAGSAQPMSYWKPVYTTSRDFNRQGWVAAVDAPRPFFAEVYGGILFGSEEMGIWAYRPVDFGEQGDSAVDGVLVQDCHRPEGETPSMIRLVPSDGVFGAGSAYLGTDAFPAAVDACAVGSLTAYVAGRSVFLSDAGAPGSVRGLNIRDIPTRRDLVGIIEVAGTLLAFSTDETWALRLSSNGLLDYADMRQLSSHVGCAGPQAKVRGDQTVAWFDANGVYSFDGGTDIENIGRPLQPLFHDGISNPLSSFYNQLGATNLANRQPSSFLRWNDPAGHMAYESKNKSVFIVLPGSSSALCFSRGSWSAWATETQANSVAATVKSINNLPNAHYAGAGGRLFCVAGPDVYDGTPTSGSAIQDGAAVFCELGVGGAIDRTAAAADDTRLFGGRYNGFNTANTGAIVIGKPVRVPAGTLIRATTLVSDAMLFPVFMLPPPGVTAVDLVGLKITIDPDWTFVAVAAPPEQVDVLFPAERDKSRDGWGFNAPAVGSEIRTYTAGAPAAGGKDLVATFDGNAVGIVETWNNQPWLVAAGNSKTPLFWLPVYGPASDSSILWTNLTAAYCRDFGAVFNLAVYAYQPDWIFNRDTTATRAQPVDWAVSTGYQQKATLNGGQKSEGEGVTRLRDIRAGIISHGDVATINSSSKYGLFNAVFAADWRDWAAQITDYTLGNAVNSKSTVRARLGGTGGVALSKKVFENALATWGEDATTKGTVLVDDEALDMIDVSSSVKGEGVHALMFGHMRGIAQRLFISSVSMFVRSGGAPRRTGR